MHYIYSSTVHFLCAVRLLEFSDLTLVVRRGHKEAGLWWRVISLKDNASSITACLSARSPQWRVVNTDDLITCKRYLFGVWTSEQMKIVHTKVTRSTNRLWLLHSNSQTLGYTNQLVGHTSTKLPNVSFKSSQQCSLNIQRCASSCTLFNKYIWASEDKVSSSWVPDFCVLTLMTDGTQNVWPLLARVNSGHRRRVNPCMIGGWLVIL